MTRRRVAVARFLRAPEIRLRKAEALKNQVMAQETHVTAMS